MKKSSVVVSVLACLVLALSCAFVVGCGRSRATSIGAGDAGGGGAHASVAAPRVVAIGSAITEAVYALGAGGLLVGVDTSSLFPEAATKLPQVGYQRGVSAEGILALKPTLILASAEAGPPAALEQLRGAGARVEVLPVEPTIEGAKARIARVAKILGRDPSTVLGELDADVARASAFVAHESARPKVLVLYARGGSALHVFGKGAAVEGMLRLAGADNAVTSFEGSKPLSPEALVSAAPDVILLPSRGLESLGGVDALLALPGVMMTPAGRARRVVAVDDLLLLGFGPRTGKAALELAEKLHANARRDDDGKARKTGGT